MELKPALSIEDQLRLLSKRGLIISDFQAAGQFLLAHNYFRLNIYFHKMMDRNNHFFEGVTFEAVRKVYSSDQWLRHQLLRLLEEVEITSKAYIAYVLALKYGPECFYDKSLFVDADYYQKLLRTFRNEIRRNKSESVVRHHTNNYGGLFPIWVVVDFLSFNSISKLMSNLLLVDCKEISKQAFQMNEEYVKSWLYSLSVLRNICAHYGYLYQRRFSIRPKLIPEFGWDMGDNDNLFVLFLILKRMINSQIWDEVLDGIALRAGKSRMIDLGEYGFPKDWKEYLLSG